MWIHTKSSFLFIVATALFCLLTTGCSDDTSAVESSEDAGVTDTGDVSTTDVYQDVADVDAADVDVGDFSYTPSWTECDCPNPEEKCSFSNFCGLPDAECDPGAGVECPDGYTCQRDHPFGDFVCICKGEHDLCTPECERQEDCPESIQSCSYDDGVCRWNRNNTGSCQTTIQCPDGYYCDVEHWRCQPTGDLEVGEDCDHDEECDTGICNRNIGECDEQCLTDEDCDEGETCARFGGGWQGYNGCWEASCDVSCPPDHRCAYSDCLPPACETTGDCDEGDCRLNPDRPEAFLPSCVKHEDPDVDRHCKPNERYSDAGYCYIPGPCWDDGHCDEPYECGGTCRREIDLEDEDS